MNFRQPKSFLINPRFQFTVIGMFVAISLFACVILYFTVYYMFRQFVSEGIALGLAKGHVYYQFIEWQKEKFDISFLLVALGVSVAMVVFGILLSHRIAGPLYRFMQYLQKEKNNPTLTSLQFREGDFFPELPEIFNEYQETKFKSLAKTKENIEKAS